MKRISLDMNLDEQEMSANGHYYNSVMYNKDKMIVYSTGQIETFLCGENNKFIHAIKNSASAIIGIYSYVNDENKWIPYIPNN